MIVLYKYKKPNEKKNIRIRKKFIIHSICEGKKIMIKTQQEYLEKWLRQLRENKIAPEALGLGNNREKAIQNLQNQLNKLQRTEAKTK